jgi:hypothetical protein
MAYRFYFARNPKSKINSGIVMPRQKQKHKIKKFFSRNTPPGFFYLTKHTKSIVCKIAEILTGKASTPHIISEPLTGGEAVVCVNNLFTKKFLCKMTKKNNKKNSQNP